MDTWSPSPSHPFPPMNELNYFIIFFPYNLLHMLHISSLLKMAVHGGGQGLSRPPLHPHSHPQGDGQCLGWIQGGLKESKELLLPSCATPGVSLGLGCWGGVGRCQVPPWPLPVWVCGGCVSACVLTAVCVCVCRGTCVYPVHSHPPVFSHFNVHSVSVFIHTPLAIHSLCPVTPQSPFTLLCLFTLVSIHSPMSIHTPVWSHPGVRCHLWGWSCPSVRCHPSVRSHPSVQ